MYKEIAIIIPALERNRYSEEGDLVRFGNLTLLEWKIIQVKNFIDTGNVFITTPSFKIKKIVKKYGANIIKRKEKQDMADVIYECGKKINKEILLWTNVTSPFLSPEDFKHMYNKFLKLGSDYDSLIAVSKLEEYIIFENNALNFEMTKVAERRSIKPIYKITNGCFIARKDIYLKFRNYFGEKPFLYEVDTLAAMEIKEVEDLTITSDLISLFIKKELKVK